MFKYQTTHTFEQRVRESARIRSTFKDRLPIIIEINPKSDLPPLTKYKYLVPVDMTLGQFAYIVFKKMKLPPEKAIFIFVNNSIHKTEAMVSELYRQHKNEDGFLYCMIQTEEAFG